MMRVAWTWGEGGALMMCERVREGDGEMWCV